MIEKLVDIINIFDQDDESILNSYFIFLNNHKCGGFDSRTLCGSYNDRC
jgi:hypothetical protein